MKDYIIGIEDNPDHAHILRRQLEQEYGTEYGIMIEQGPWEFMSCYLNHREDIKVILMNLCIPEMDGFMLTKMIRERSNVPIIAVTATVTDETRAMADEAGMNGFVAKPYYPSTLFNVINEHLI